MIGQGGPRPSKLPFRCWMRVAAAWALSLALCPAAVVCAQGESAESEPPALRLRIEWGGGEVRAWQCASSVVQGRLAAPQLLGIEADEAGSMWIEDGKLVVYERGRRQYDGVDLDVHAPLVASLIVQLVPQDDPAAGGAIEVPLAKLVREMHNAELDKQQNRVLVRRAPGDKLRISLPFTDKLVFSCGEQLDLRVQPWRVEAPADSKLRLLSRLLDPKDGRVLWSQEEERVVDEQGASDPVAFSAT